MSHFLHLFLHLTLKSPILLILLTIPYACTHSFYHCAHALLVYVFLGGLTLFSTVDTHELSAESHSFSMHLV